MKKLCTVIVVILLAVIAGGAYKFLIQGSVVESSDGRLAIQLNASERDLVLQEMRTFLATIQQVTQGITENDMVLIAESARKVGSAAQGAVPGTLMGKLPMEFKQLGFDTHTKFDQLAMDAEDLGDGSHALGQLSTLIQNCVSCHAVYRIELATE
ncbi:MAG: hypothetical protein OEY09_08895 [Gammaproteobacteria bacterium]|nr:hypothetical protein [Gammaproteobacteria bacterium]